MSVAAPLQVSSAKPQSASLSVGGGLLQRKWACGSSKTLLTETREDCQSHALQDKLTIGASNDPLEIEADRVADQVLAASTHPVVTAVTPSIQRFVEQPAGQTDAVPTSIEHALTSPGSPLEPGLRHDMEQRFGYDFSRVRVHTGGAAEQSAQDINARAYTVGHHIVLGAGRSALNSHDGRRLIAHELVHVVQQSGTTVSRDPRKDKDRVPRPVTTVASCSYPVIQRQLASAESSALEPGVSNSSLDGLIERAAMSAARTIRSTLPMPIPESILAALMVAEAEFIRHGFRRLVREGAWRRITSRAAELLDPLAVLEFNGRYVWGVLKGLVSPVTGLLHLLGATLQFPWVALTWIREHAGQVPGLLDEAQALGNDFQRFVATASQTLGSLSNGDRLLEFAGAIFSATSTADETIERQLVAMARQKGREAADSLVDGLLNTPLPQMAETAGEIVGTVFIEVVMFLFSSGIGNLITRVGELVRALRPLSRGVMAFLDVAMLLGRLITQVEEIIGVLLSRTLLRPLMPLFEALEPLLGRMRQFARRLVGLSEASTRALARAGTGVVQEGTSASARAAERSPATEALPQPAPSPRASTMPPAPTPATTPPPTTMTEPAASTVPLQSAVSSTVEVPGPMRPPMTPPVEPPANPAPRASETPELRERWPDLERSVSAETELVQGPLDEGILAQRLRPQQSLPESLEAARQAGISDLVTGDGWVMTRADFPDVVPDRPLPMGSVAPPPLPTLGRRVSSSDVQNLEVRSDLLLTQDALSGSGARIVDVRIDQTQVTDVGTRAGTNRPDLQLTILRADLNGRRIFVEYDRSPPTRALDHARRILTNDPDAIVILKIIDFESGRR